MAAWISPFQNILMYGAHSGWGASLNAVNRPGEPWRLLLLAGSLVLGGCASQGPLKAPSLNLPASVVRLNARRVGNAVTLSWTNPTKTSDGVGLMARHGAGALQAQVCRSETPPATTCTPFALLPVTSGSPSTVRDSLQAPLTAGAVRPLYYGVRVVNASGKGAGWTVTTTAAGTAPEPLRNLQAQPVAHGVLLRWQAGDTGVMLRVSRGADTAHSILLAVGHQGDARSAVDGTVDTDGHAGQEQRYVAYRQTSIRVGNDQVVLESDPAMIVVPAAAKLPLPAAPTSLEAVANTLGAPKIDLVWQPPDDPTITGFRVYRQGSDGASTLLTAQPVAGFTYTDATAIRGQHYVYRVCAVNTTGESSAATVAASLP